MAFPNISSEQALSLVNAKQVFEHYEQVKAKQLDYLGSMHWKQVSGREYLYRMYTGGRGASLGPRSPENEQIKEKHETGKADNKNQLKELEAKLKLHAGFIRTVGLNRLPVTAARVIRLFNKEQIPYRVIGTNALYVYELAGGVLIAPEHLATMDVDIMLDARQSIKIAAKLNKRTMLSLLQKADQSFTALTKEPREFSAANSAGYRVDFISQQLSSFEPSSFETLLQPGDLLPVEIDTLKWQISSPVFSGIVFDTRGMPVRVSAIDPRAFMLHKWHTAQQADREPVKRTRDLAQAKVVAAMLNQSLLSVNSPEIIKRIFPNLVVEHAREDGLDF